MGNRKPEVRFKGLEGGEPSIELREFQVRIDCKGRKAQEALEELRKGLIEAATHRMDALVVLNELGLLQDSVMTFIKGLSRLLVGYPQTVTFWESSGYTEAFLSVMEAPPPTSGTGTTPESHS